MVVDSLCYESLVYYKVFTNNVLFTKTKINGNKKPIVLRDKHLPQ